MLQKSRIHLSQLEKTGCCSKDRDLGEFCKIQSTKDLLMPYEAG